MRAGYNVCLTSDPRLTLNYFMIRSNVFLNVFIWGKAVKKCTFLTFEAKVMILDIFNIMNETKTLGSHKKS